MIPYANHGLYQAYDETGSDALTTTLWVRKLRQEEVTAVPSVS